MYWHKSLWRRSPLTHHRDCKLYLRPNYREGAQPHPSAGNWIKDLLGMALPTRASPSFPHSQSLPSGSAFVDSHSSEGRHNGNHNQRKWTKMMALYNSMKLWTMPYRTTQDGWVMAERYDKTWFTGEGDGKPLQHSCLENPMNSMKRQKHMTLKDEPPGLVGVQYTTGEECRNKSRRNEEAEPKWRQCPVVDVWWWK